MVVSGDPDLVVGPISLWALSRSTEPSADPWWVDDITCRLTAKSGAVTVELDGAIPSRSFQFFVDQLQGVYERLDGRAMLDASELGGALYVFPTTQGHVSIEATFWPHSGWNGTLTLTYRTDQTFLPPIIRSCRKILERFPVLADLKTGRAKTEAGRQ